MRAVIKLRRGSGGRSPKGLQKPKPRGFAADAVGS